MTNVYPHNGINFVNFDSAGNGSGGGKGCVVPTEAASATGSDGDAREVNLCPPRLAATL